MTRPTTDLHALAMSAMALTNEMLKLSEAFTETETIAYDKCDFDRLLSAYSGFYSHAIAHLRDGGAEGDGPKDATDGESGGA